METLEVLSTGYDKIYVLSGCFYLFIFLLFMSWCVCGLPACMCVRLLAYMWVCVPTDACGGLRLVLEVFPLTVPPHSLR